MKRVRLIGLVAVGAVVAALIAFSWSLVTSSSSPVAEAAQVPHTHERYMHITWVPAGGNAVDFTIQSAWRRNAGANPCIDVTTNLSIACSTGDGLPQVGDVIREGQGGTRFDPGDGSGLIGSPSGSLYYVVTSIDPPNNWLFGLALDPASLPTIDTAVTHTYGSSGNFTAFIDSCCRISGVVAPNEHINNPDGFYRTETVVNAGGTNNSPVTVQPPIRVCPINGLCSFLIPAGDADGDALTCRLSTSTEASSVGGFDQPGPPDATNAAAINASSCIYTWNTAGATLASNTANNTLYSTQVTIEDATSKVAVDFLIQLKAQVGNAPVFVQPPTPTCGTALSATIGVPVNFTVQASDPDAGDTVTLNVVGLPAGATMTPTLPTSGNAVSSAFSYTPSAAGTSVVLFTADDTGGNQTTCSVTIGVTVVVTGNRFCIAGTSTGVGWTWSIFGKKSGSVANGTVAGGGSASDIANAWVASMNAVTGSPTATQFSGASSNCFRFSPGGQTLEVDGSTIGTTPLSFNPTVVFIPAPVGGITELLVGGSDASSAAEGSGSSAVLYAALGGLVAAVALATAGGWYARRRFLR